jgi:membrane-associated protease RseP (regulator of RpoE activity)
MSESPRFEHGPDYPELSGAHRALHIDHPPATPAPVAPEARRMRGIATHALLFLATILTTLLAGTLLAGVNPFATPELIYKGAPFSFAIMAILLSHEMGHYLMSRRHKVEATLPYFIPAPTLVGTFGAVIKMRSPVPSRSALLDIGAAGPIVGFIVSIPFLVVGLKLSEIRPGVAGDMNLGASLLLGFMEQYLFPSVPDGHVLYLHPVAFAGWLGMLVTMLNLLPIGSMDGGHIAYAVFGKRHALISRVFVVALLATGAIGYLLGIYGLIVWGVWGTMNIFIGLRHPPPVDSESPLDGKRKLVAVIAALIFILTFVPIPIP